MTDATTARGFPGSEGVSDGVFHAAYRTRRGMWRTGMPQPAVVDAIDRGWFSCGRILDAGCGSGENAIAVARARASAHVVAWDLVPEAVALARIKSRVAGVESRIDFAAVDLRRPPDATSFGEVLDAGVLHLFSDVDRSTYLRAIRRLLSPGGWFTAIVFSDAEKRAGGPRRMGRDELDGVLVEAAFEVVSIEAVRYETSAHEGGARAWMARARAI